MIRDLLGPVRDEMILNDLFGTLHEILMAGLGSANKYSLLGAMRAAAQLISYEVPEVLSVLPVVLLAGTMSLWGITAAQSGGWFILAPVVGPLAFLVFFVSGVAEIN